MHCLGIQAFQPKMIEGKFSLPLACTAFNADFKVTNCSLTSGNDAVLEAQILMLASQYFKSCKWVLSQYLHKIWFLVYYMTKPRPGALGEGLKFYSPKEVIIAYNERKVSLNAKITVKTKDVQNGLIITRLIDTTVGRVLVNECVPDEVGFINEVLSKKSLRDIISKVISVCGVARTADFLDEIKNMGYYMAFKGCLSFNLQNVIIPKEKDELVKEGYEKVEAILNDYNMGFITYNERYNQIIDTWTHVNSKLSNILMKQLSEDDQGFNSVFMMLDSGARGSKEQIRQLSGMRGLMAKPQKAGAEGGQIIENPILANFKEGLSVLEYFISTHGARKGLADTALKTADAGYLTRRLVDVSHDVIITEEDGTPR